MKIYIGTDHAGLELKQALVSHLKQAGHDVVDKGAYELDAQDDYPDFIIPTAQAVVQDEGSLGIVIGGSGQGEALAANKVKGARAALYYGGPTDIVTLSRSHNNANILSLGARFLSADEAKQAVDLWLGSAPQLEERHTRRLEKITQFEESQ